MKNDNKLIADFMGVNVITINDVRENKNPYISSADGHLESELKYHTSWDWLMPVVNKCMQTGDNTDEWDALYDALSTVNKTNIHEAVVEFIKNLN